MLMVLGNGRALKLVNKDVQIDDLSVCGNVPFVFHPAIYEWKTSGPRLRGTLLLNHV